MQLLRFMFNHFRIDPGERLIQLPLPLTTNLQRVMSLRGGAAALGKAGIAEQFAQLCGRTAVFGVGMLSDDHADAFVFAAFVQLACLFTILKRFLKLALRLTRR